MIGYFGITNPGLESTECNADTIGGNSEEIASPIHAFGRDGIVMTGATIKRGVSQLIKIHFTSLV